MLPYRKFCYWMDRHNFEKAKERLEEDNAPMTQEAQIPCRLLKPSKERGYVVPRAWTGVCQRRVSWYWNSERAEKILIVSNAPLHLPGFKYQILISESDFKPDRLPSSQEITQLMKSEEFRKRKPLIWEKVDGLEKDFYQRWFERHRIEGRFDFEKILTTHSANHVNFLEPRFFVTEENLKVPYSICDSLHICSSCLEFFNILGTEWLVKYVVPCIGAVQFAHLPLNQYFRVETEGL